MIRNSILISTQWFDNDSNDFDSTYREYRLDIGIVTADISIPIPNKYSSKSRKRTRERFVSI